MREAAVAAGGAGAQTVDLNSTRGLASTILLGVIGPEVFIVQPGFVQGLVQNVGFSEQGAGYTASVEMFGIAATTVALAFLAHRLDWRKLLYASLLLMFVSNAACAFVHDLNTFAVLRVFAGLGAGGIITLTFTAIGLTRSVDRNFGLLIMWVLIYGAVGLLVMPAAFRLIGMSGVLWFFALFPLVGVPFVRYMPHSGQTVTEVRADAVDLGVPLKSSALLAMFVYFLAQGVVWAYLFLIGVNAGLTEQQVANGLTISQFAGVAGAFAAAWLAHRTHHTLALIIGIVGGCGGALSLDRSFQLPAVRDRRVHLQLCVEFHATGAARRHGEIRPSRAGGRLCGGGPDVRSGCGPGSGRLRSGHGTLASVIWVGLALFFLSLALILPPVLAQARRVHGVAVT